MKKQIDFQNFIPVSADKKSIMKNQIDFQKYIPVSPDKN